MPITIVVAVLSETYYEARIKDSKRKYVGTGASPYEAIGELVCGYPELFTVITRTDPTLEDR